MPESWASRMAMSAAERAARFDVPLPSSDPPLSRSSANPFMAAEAQSGANALREYMMQFGQFNGGLREAVSEITGLVHNLREGTPPGTMIGGSLGSQHHASSNIEQHAAEAAQQTQPEHQRRMTFTEGREMGHALTMRDASQRVSGFLSERLSQRQRTWNPEPQVVNGQSAFVETDAAGNVTRQVGFNSANPESVEYARGQVARMSRFGNVNAAATGAFGRYAAGEGIAGALGGSVAKVAGPIGLAVGAAMKGMDIYTDQLAAGAEFRQIYGQDAGRFALRERGARQMAGLESYFSGMGRERGMQAYTAGAQMGLTGDRLEAATDFDRQMFMQQGMGVEQSMRFVQMNAQNSSISLEELSKQIEQVGSSAVDAGKNSQEAIEAFASTTEMLTSGVTATAGAPAIAAGVQTAMQANLPKALSGAENLQAVTGGALSQQNVIQYAVTHGLDPGQVMNQLALDQSGQLGQQITGGSMERAAVNICRAGGTSLEAFQATVEEMFPGRGTRLSPDEQLAVLTRYPRINNITIKIGFQTQGITFPDDAQLIPQFFGAAMGAYTSTASAGQGKSPLDLISGIGQRALQASGGTIEGGYKNLEGESTADKTRALEGEIWGKDSATGTFGALYGQPSDVADLFGKYSSSAAESGNRNVALEGLLKNASEIDKAGTGSGLGEAKFNIEGETGGKTLSEIMADPKLMAKLGTGGVTLAGEGGQAIDIDKWTGMDGEETASPGTPGAPGTGPTQSLVLTGYAEKLFKLTGPTDSQKNGIPEVGNVWSTVQH